MRKLELLFAVCLATIGLGCIPYIKSPWYLTKIQETGEATARGMLQAPESAGFEGRLQQMIELKRGDKVFECLAVVEVSKTEVTMVGMSPLGQRLLRVHWDGAALEKDVDPSLPPELPAVSMLRDFMIAYWPLKALQASLKGWTIEETASARSFRAPRKPRLDVAYVTEPGWGASLTIQHHDPDYEIKVTTLEMETE